MAELFFRTPSPGRRGDKKGKGSTFIDEPQEYNRFTAGIACPASARPPGPFPGHSRQAASSSRLHYFETEQARRSTEALQGAAWRGLPANSGARPTRG
jgi:hypothetical protein